MKNRNLMLILLLVCAFILPPLTSRGETVSNGGVTMFTVGEYLIGLLLHQDKKILIYRVSTAPNNIALKSVRTWHYDAQYANSLKTLLSDGLYPKNIDPKNGPGRLNAYFQQRKDEAFNFDPAYKIPGLGSGTTGTGGGGDLCLVLETTGNQGTLIILDSKNSALVTYQVTEQALDHMGTRSILLDAQIPIAYPSAGSKSPLFVRKELLAMKKVLDKSFEKEKKNPEMEKAIPFEVEDLAIVREILERDE